MNTEEIIIARWEDSRWITLSSISFCIPAIYAYYRLLYFHFLLYFFVSIISANYWRKATYSWRRTLDITYSKISFIISLGYGFVYITDICYLYICYSFLFLIAYLYYVSYKLHKLNNKHWINAHMLFHILITCLQFIVVDSIYTNGLLPY